MSVAAGTDRRSHPRFAVHLPLRVRNVEMYTTNLSRSGAQLACALNLATIIQRDLAAGRLRLELELPDGPPCVAQSAIRYINEVEDELLIGIEHEVFEDDGQARYLAFCEGAAEHYRQVS